MKTQIFRRTLSTAAILFMMSLVGIGCAKKNDASPVPADVAVVPAVDSRNVTPNMNYTSGESVAFIPENADILNTYVGTHPINSPTNFLLNVNLTDIGNNSGKFGGVIQLSYFDNGSYYNGVFNSGTGVVNISYQNRDTGKPTAEFNQWFAWNGQKVFHGFFQDQYGAVMLVIDDSLGLGDGGLPTEVSGSVWFKNFQPTPYPQSAEKCWFIRIGPYDCRTFLDGADNISTTSALEPANGYRKLGKFSGLNVKKAFNL